LVVENSSPIALSSNQIYLMHSSFADIKTLCKVVEEEDSMKNFDAVGASLKHIFVSLK